MGIFTLVLQDGETKAQRPWGFCVRSHNEEWHNQDSKPGMSHFKHQEFHQLPPQRDTSINTYGYLPFGQNKFL